MGYLLNLRVDLIDETKDSTVSSLYANGNFLSFVIEDGHRDIKEWGKTRIPGGKYNVIKRRYGRFYERYKSQMGHDFVLELENVPNFTAILIHSGNTIKDTNGCLLPNEYYTKRDGNWVGSSSRSAYKKLYDIAKDYNKIQIDINR